MSFGDIEHFSILSEFLGVFEVNRRYILEQIGALMNVSIGSVPKLMVRGCYTYYCYTLHIQLVNIEP